MMRATLSSIHHSSLRIHHLSLLLPVGCPLADAEDDELGGTKRRDADETDETPVVEIILRHRRAVAAHEVRLVGLVTQERSLLPLVQEEVFDCAADVAPKLRAVRLEDGPLRAAVNGAFEIDEVATQVDVLPFGVGSCRARSPQTEAAPLEVAEAVDTIRV